MMNSVGIKSIRFKLRKIAAVVGACIALGIGVTTAASATTTSPVEGSWLYTVTIPGPFVFKGVETYAGGGGYSEADQLAFTPGYLATAGHGGWKQTGPHTFLLTYMNLTYLNGNPTGYSRVRQIATFDAQGLRYRGSGDFKYYDNKGEVIKGGTGTFTITAYKILVQAPQ